MCVNVRQHKIWTQQVLFCFFHFGDDGPHSGKRLICMYLKFRQQYYSLSRCSGVGKVPSVITHLRPHILQCSYFVLIYFDLYIETYGPKRVCVSIYLLLAY